MTGYEQLGRRLFYAMRRLWPACGIVAVSSAFSGCARQEKGSELLGEWTVQMTAIAENGGSTPDRAVAGVIVFHDSLPLWAEKMQIGFPPPHIRGRVFVPMSLLTSDSAPRTTANPYHRDRGGPRLSDEVIGTISDRRVNFVVAPGVIGGRYEFKGTMLMDTVRGEWKMPPHPHQLRGSFRMWRARHPAAADSARVWATRRPREP